MGLMTCYVLFFIEIGSREVRIAGVTLHPNQGIHSIPSVRLLLRDQLAPIMVEKARLAQQPREALAVEDR